MPTPRIIPASPTTNPLIVFNPPLTNNEALVPIRKVTSAVFISDPNGVLSLALVTNSNEQISIFFDNQADYIAFHDQFLALWPDIEG